MDFKISFIIPLYNDENNIGKCISSIISEKATDDELIIVNNGSTDSSQEIVSGFNEAQLLNIERGTIAFARNCGARISKNGILAFIDSDCILCPGWRSEVQRAFENSNLDATGSKYLTPKYASWIERAWYSQRANKNQQVKYINSGNLIIKRDVFFSVDGFNEKLITGEDAEFGWRLNRHNYKVIEVPSVKVIHLGNPKNIKDFYKKQKWHAKGMMGTFKISFFDKPVIMTILFLLSIIVFSASVIFKPKKQYLSLLLWIQTLTAVYRVKQYKNYKYFFQLIYLYNIYYLARTVALVQILYSYITKVYLYINGDI